MEICEICQKECASKLGLMAHMRIHQSSKNKDKKKEDPVYAVCIRPGGYFDTNSKKGLKMPCGVIVKLTKHQWNQAKGIKGVREVKIGDGVKV